MMATSCEAETRYVTPMAPLHRARNKIVWDDALKFTKDFFAGASAAVVAKTVIAPVERVKLILQLQNAQTTLAAEKRYKGVIDCFIRVPKEQGFFSFWRGNWVNILRACSQESLGFAFKDFFKIWSLNGVDPSAQQYRFLIGNLAAGGGAGVATFMIIYPLDFVRTRLAIDLGKDKRDREFRGMFDCMRKIIRHDGFFGMYKGLLPSLQYIMIYRGAYYGLFDSAKPYISKDGRTLGFWRAFAAGQVVTFVAAMLSYPLDTIRRRLMMGAGKKEFIHKGTIDCARYIYVNEGWRAFFHGAMVNAMRGTGAALVLALYNEMAKYMRRQFNLRQIFVTGTCGFTLSLLGSLSLGYFAIYTENLPQKNRESFRRIMQDFNNSESPVFYIYKTIDIAIKYPILALLLLFYLSFTGTFFLDRYVENYARACQPQNRDSSYARTLQLSRAFGAAGFVTIVGAILPYSYLVACLVFELNIGVWAIAIPLGSAFVPAMIPITIFYFTGRYRRAVFKLFLDFRP